MKALILSIVALGVALTGCASSDLFQMSPRTAGKKITSCDHTRQLAASRCFVLHDEADIKRFLQDIYN